MASGRPSGFPAELQTLQAMGLRLPADCGGAACTCTCTCTYTYTPTALSVAVDWSGAGTAANGMSLQRSAATRLSADWHAAAQSFGAGNP
jgi:hypothetical protein